MLCTKTHRIFKNLLLSTYRKRTVIQKKAMILKSTNVETTTTKTYGERRFDKAAAFLLTVVFRSYDTYIMWTL